MKTVAVFCCAAIFAAGLSSCIPTQSLAADPVEQYIKTRIEEHAPGQSSAIRIYPIYTASAMNVQAELRFTGYKYNNEKKLVLCVLPFTYATAAGKTSKTYSDKVFVTLTQGECQAIVDNYKLLQEKLETETGAPGEYVYQDYTVNDNLFISFRGETSLFTKKVVAPVYLDFWILSEKYTLSTSEAIDKIKIFLAY